MQNITLKDLLSDCFTGLIKNAYTSVDEADNVKQEPTNLIKIKHITDEGLCVLEELEKVILADRYKKGKSKDFTLHAGDILLAARGEKLKMVLLTEKELVNSTTFDTNIILLRVNQKLIKPEILLNYLQSPLGLANLKDIQKGAAILSINPRELVTLTIPVPPLDEQEKMTQEHWASKNLYISTLVMAEKQKQMANSQIWSRFVE